MALLWSERVFLLSRQSRAGCLSKAGWRVLREGMCCGQIIGVLPYRYYFQRRFHEHRLFLFLLFSQRGRLDLFPFFSVFAAVVYFGLCFSIFLIGECGKGRVTTVGGKKVKGHHFLIPKCSMEAGETVVGKGGSS